MRGHGPIRLCRNLIAADGVTTLKTQKAGLALSFVAGRSTVFEIGRRLWLVYGHGNSRNPAEWSVYVGT